MPAENARERVGARAEQRPAGVILEADEGADAGAVAEVALAHDVADHPRRPGERLQVEQADARHLAAVLSHVAVPGELVAAAHREHRGAAGDGRVHGLAVPQQVLGDEQLVAILAAADQVQVGGLGVELLADPQRPLLELEAAPLEPPADDLDVAAVGVDREVLGIELAEHELHAAAASQ